MFSCLILSMSCSSRLTLEQKELCRSRLKLLCYLDRLATYEVTPNLCFCIECSFKLHAFGFKGMKLGLKGHIMDMKTGFPLLNDFHNAKLPPQSKQTKTKQQKGSFKNHNFNDITLTYLIYILNALYYPNLHISIHTPK